MIADNLPILVILVYCMAALLMPILGPWRPRIPAGLAFLTNAIALGLSVLTLLTVLREGTLTYAVGNWPPPIGIELVADPLSAFFLVTVNLVSMVILYHAAFGSREAFSPAYGACVMLMLGGFAGIIGTGDLFNLFVFLELSSLAGYAVLGSAGGRAAHATFRYLLMGTMGASFYLLGLGFLYAETGSLNMGDLRLILETVGLGTAGRMALVLMVTGICLKMALFPLHQWLPDTYTFAPPLSTALVAPIGTKIAVYVLIRIYFDVYPPEMAGWSFPFLQLLIGAGLIAILWGSVMAIAQADLKRMLAYSSVSQIGYIALGIGLANPFGLIGAVLHVLNHAVMKACLFLFSARIEEATGKPPRIEDLTREFSRRFPFAAAGFTAAAVSMIGLPPLAGFFSKWYLLRGALDAHAWIAIAVVVLSSLLNAVYFFRILERLYLRPAVSDRGKGRMAVRLSPAQAAVSLLALLLLAAGLFNVSIVDGLLHPIVTKLGL